MPPKLLINIQNSTILDLFSGVGSFGIECLSRGANETVFIERNRSITKILSKNLINLSLENKDSI